MQCFHNGRSHISELVVVLFPHLVLFLNVFSQTTFTLSSQPAGKLKSCEFILVSIRSEVQLVLMHYVTLYRVA